MLGILMDSLSLVSIPQSRSPTNLCRLLIENLDVSNPGSYEDFVELLVPVLQERGIMWKDYAVPGGTFRENLRRKAGDNNLPPNHIGAQFRYDALKEKYADKFGDIVIDRKKEKEDDAGLESKVNGLTVAA
jgi:hypothetical protein